MEHEQVNVLKILPEWKQSLRYSPSKYGMISRLSIFLLLLTTTHVPVIIGLTVEHDSASCNSPKQVLLGNKAEIICNFDANYTHRIQNVYLEHFNLETYLQEVPVYCQISEGIFKCKCIKGYTVIGNVTERLSVEIQVVVQKHAGIYSCGGFQPDPFQYSTCDIKVIDGQFDTVSTTLATVMKYISARTGEANEVFLISIGEIIIVIIVAIPIFSLIAIFFVLNLTKGRCGPFDKNPKSESQESLIIEPFDKNSKTDCQEILIT